MLSSCRPAACATYGPHWVYRVRASGNVSSLTAAARGGRAAPRCGAGAGLAAVTRTITEYQHGRLSDDATIVLIEWMPLTPSCEGPFLTTRGIRSAAEPTGTSRNEAKSALSLGTPADCRNLRGRRIAAAGTGRERDSGQAVALQTARTSRGDLRASHGEELPMFVHTARLQLESRPDKRDPVYACTSCRSCRSCSAAPTVR
jgi:hypothetical protein